MSKIVDFGNLGERSADPPERPRGPVSRDPKTHYRGGNKTPPQVPHSKGTKDKRDYQWQSKPRSSDEKNHVRREEPKLKYRWQPKPKKETPKPGDPVTLGKAS